MSRILVNIRGCNGAGKSTIPMSMMSDSKMFVQELKYSDGKRMGSFTVFPSYGWIALGTYFNKTGGLDGIRNMECTIATLYAAISMYPDFNIIMEGILCSTVFSSYAELFHKVEKQFGIQVLIISLLPPLEVCLDRIQKRNGGKPIKEDLVAGKRISVERSHEKFKGEGFTCVRVDSSKVPKSRMLPAFLKTVSKYEE